MLLGAVHTKKLGLINWSTEAAHTFTWIMETSNELNAKFRNPGKHQLNHRPWFSESNPVMYINLMTLTD